jgi:PKD repeat protein
MNKKFFLAGLGLYFGLSSFALSQSQSESSTSLFQEVTGEREFSGWMIARPIQAKDFEALGFDAETSSSLHAFGSDILASFDMQSYVDVTDEFIFALPGGMTENMVSTQLMASGVFQYVEPDWTLYPVGDPNDPRFADQWQHNANRMQSADGWDLHTGNPSVGVAFCDTGVRTSHEDLQLHRLEGYNAVDQQWESAGGNIQPVHNHGTRVTGCGAANGNNGLGVSGVGWNLSHRMMRVSNQSTGSAAMSTLQHAARTAIEAGDRVASVSYSGPDSSSNLTTATYIKSQGGLLVWAAGNDSRNLTFGNRDADDIIIAGASDSNDNKASFSAYGSYVDLVAPGSSVLTTDYDNDSDYAYASGTSFACPITAGLCGLIWSADPTLTPDEVESILKQGADDLGSAGADNTFGHGRINVYEAMVLATGGGGGGNPPTANFSGTPTSGTSPLVVSFNDSSSGSPTSWSWNFGDGGSSTAQNPSHTYTSAGDYTVVLTVSNAYGNDTQTRTDYISVTDPGGFTGQGFQLSKNADFSTTDSVFSTSDTVYMLVWDDRMNVNRMRTTKWQLKAGNRKVNGGFVNHGDGSFTSSHSLSNLPSNASSWTWKGTLKDRSRNTYAPSTSISVN